MDDRVFARPRTSVTRSRRLFAAILVTVMAASLAAGLTSDEVRTDWAPEVAQEQPIPHTDFPLVRAEPPPAQPVSTEVRDAVWPRAAKAGVTAGPQPRQVGDLPVAVASSRRERSFQVEVHDQEASREAAVTGVLFTVTPEEHQEDSETSVGVDYSAFGNAVGADFGSRLRLVRLPNCAITTPEVGECRVQTPLPSTNDTRTRTVTAQTAITTTAVFAATAEPTGSNGTFQASTLAPSGAWSVSGSAGGFTWAYPIVLPPSASGSAVAPKVALSYSSASVDGRTLATNNQTSWIGQGWDYSPGAIERTYRTCAQDKSLPEAQQTGDLCWAGQIVTLVLDGKSTELVRDDATGTWRASTDGGARIELLPGATNGARNGEYWKVTTTAGISYYFGLNRGPGHTNQEQTNSAWTVPVYGPRPGDECHNPTGFAQSWCTQAWRWNLDFVEDPHGNTTAYYYTPETNHYGANLGTTGVVYTRGGTLKRIDYGLRKANGSIYGSAAPNQVVFDVAERCLPTAEFDCAPAKFTAANAKHWPDTPQDQDCKAGTTCNNHSPTFWTTKRLTTITTRYDQGAGPVKVDVYALGHEFKDIANKELWLASITRTGYDKDGKSITVPPIAFTGQVFANRVEGYNNLPALVHWRVTNIATETGTSINITYSRPDCTATSIPTDLANNDRRCYPVNWTLPRNSEPTLDYFHKYVVDRVEVQDRNGISPTQVTTYTYLGAPAWHYDELEIVRPEHRTYGQFRGYGKVEERHGNTGHSIDGVHDKQTLTRTTYFRGMDGDVLPGGGRRTVAVHNSLGESVVDHRQFAGMKYEQESFNGDGGARISTTVSEPILLATTATRVRPGLPPLLAEIIGLSRNRAITYLVAGGVRSVTTTNRHDSLGRLVAKTESGDGVQDLCTRSMYADNLSTWVRDRVAETTVSQQTCPADDVPQTSILKSTRTYYDGSDVLGAVTVGAATRVDSAVENDNDRLTYATTLSMTFDAAGRSTSVTDAINRTARTAYTPVDGGVLTKTTKTNPKNQTSFVEFEPSRGNTVVSSDVGARRTEAVYDSLGRLTAVWKPGQTKGFTPATVTYHYLLRTDGPSTVTTKTLVDYGTGTNHLTQIELFDAFGRVRQSQTDSHDGGRIVSDSFHDSHGRIRISNNGYITTGAPGTTLISVDTRSVNSRTVIDHDGAGRVVRETAYKGATATWDTKTVYGGDRVTVFPPLGGTTTTTITDARGREVESRKYTSPPAVNGDVVSGGIYKTITTEYTALGQREKLIDDVGNRWTYTYDMLGRKKSQTDPDAGESSTKYDLAGQVITTTDARQRTLAYKYDELGRKTAEHADSLDGPLLASWLYDGAVNGVGLPWYSTRHTPEGKYISGISHYSGAGLVFKSLVQIPASEIGLGGLYTTTYGYTTTGLLTQLQQPTAGGLPGEAIGITYNKYGKPLTTTGYNAYVSESTYTPYGEPRQFTLGPSNNKAWLTYDYEPQTRRPQRTNLSVQQADAQVEDIRYTYDPAGNVTKIVNTWGLDGRAQIRTQCASYDALRRLVEGWTSTDDCARAPSNEPGTANIGGPNPYWSSWRFASSGVRAKHVLHALPGAAGGDTATVYDYPTSERQPHTLSSSTTTGPTGTTTSTYKYDEVGNTTLRSIPTGEQTLTWDEANRLHQVVGPVGTTEYVYDADGKQLVRRDPDGTTVYLPGQELTWNSTTGMVTGTRYYVHNGTTVALRVGNTNPDYVVSDLHGTVSTAVDSVSFAVTRRVVDAYGNVVGTGGTWPDRHGFLNKPFSEATGLVDIGARKYDPVTGRFVSVDPVLDGSDAQQMTGYSYANDNPWSFSDPTGLIRICGPDGVGCGARNYDECCGPSSDDQPLISWQVDDGLVVTYHRPSKTYYINEVFLPKTAPDLGRLLYHAKKDMQDVPVPYRKEDDTGLLMAEEVYILLERACDSIHRDCSAAFVIDLVLERPDVGMGTDAAISMLGAAAGMNGAGKMAKAGGRSGPAAENYRGRFQVALRAQGKPRLPNDWDAHHAIPQAYRNHPEFKDFDFDAPENIRGVPGSRLPGRTTNHHQQITNRWDEFARANPNASRSDIEKFAERVDAEFIGSYWYH